MKLTEDEKQICEYYCRWFPDGELGCHKCPLMIDESIHLCKVNFTREMWEKKKKHETDRCTAFD